jgi:hypothetical protein
MNEMRAEKKNKRYQDTKAHETEEAHQRETRVQEISRETKSQVGS